MRLQRAPLSGFTTYHGGEGAKPAEIPMHPADWEAYPWRARQARCQRCAAALAPETLFYHCAACLATRRIDEPTLVEATVRFLGGLWPLGEERLDARRWVHAFIAFWRGVVDPVLMRAHPYNGNTLYMTLWFVKQQLRRTCGLVQLPEGCHYGGMALRMRGETLALNVDIGVPLGASSMVGLSKNQELESLDHVLDTLGLAEGWLVVEKPSYRARRDDPVKERTLTTARGHQIHRLECRNEKRYY